MLHAIDLFYRHSLILNSKGVKIEVRDFISLRFLAAR